MSRFVCYLALALFFLVGCAPKSMPEDATPDPPDTTVSPDEVVGVGTITYFDLEGGFYGIVADDGGKYDPMGLDEAFQQDGLRVRFRARRRSGVITINQWGRPVEILEITRIDDK